MIVDLHRDRISNEMAFPVVIIGGGPAGITLALKLEERGVPSLLLEAGATRFDAAGQDFLRAASIAPDDHGPVDLFRRRRLGGTSTVWGGRCIPFDPIDLEERGWIPHARWPIAHAELLAYYPEALALCRAGPAQFAARDALPPDSEPGMFDMLDRDLITDRIERFSEPTDFGRAYHDRLRRSRYAVVALHAPVTRIRATPGGRALEGVVVAHPDGHEWFVRASRVVIAAGALETVRVLLSSVDEKPCGLGNEHDLVGRFYQSHLEGHMGALHVNPGAPARLDYFRDANAIYCRRYMWLSPEAQRRAHLAGLVLRPTHAKVADPGHRDAVLSAMFLAKTLVPPEYAHGLNSTEYREALRIGRGHAIRLRHWGNVVRGSPRLAAFAADWTRRRVLARRKLPSVFLVDRHGRYALDVNAEQRPNPDSRVSLGAPRDALGQRRLVIDWRIQEEDRQSVVRGVALADAALRRAGVARIVLPDPAAAAAALTRVGGHHIGTARMADTARDGVIDRHGELFDVHGLYVLGAAGFPTSGFANPTLTIVALAMRLGEHLALRIATPFS